MPRTLRLLAAFGVLAAVPLLPGALGAQAPSPAPQSAAADSLAFPRQFVQWILSAQGDSAFAHAAPQLRENMKSGADVNGTSARMQTRFGERQGTDAEVQFDEGALNVYIVVMRFAQAPEPGAWIVAYAPSTRVVERASFSSLTDVKSRYPQAKLP